MAETDPDIELAAHLLAGSGHAIALVGAGISVESGIPPFRGPGGLWTRLGQPSGDQYRQFLEDPTAWWQRMRSPDNPRRADAAAWENAKPNPAHYALAELEEMGVLHHVVTQNVDNLHQEAGTRSITEFHGNRYKLRCIRCRTRFERSEFELGNEPPVCPGCGGIVKTDTVMYGEPIPPYAIQRAFQEARQADCILIIGTSAVVYPAADVPNYVRRNGGGLIEVNPEETPLSYACDAVLRGPAGEVMPGLVAAVKRLRAEAP